MTKWIRQLPNFLDSATLARICRQTVEAGLIGRSPLAGTFRSSAGFSVTFRASRPGIDQLRTFSNGVVDYLKALSQQPALWRYGSGLRRWPSFGNAFFLNVLVLPPDARVAKHIDATLAIRRRDRLVTPCFVSVLYLQLPTSFSGGELCVQAGRSAWALPPELGRVYLFPGGWQHSIQPFCTKETRGRRISLVCEHYRLGRAEQRKLPDFKVYRRRPFSQVLQAELDRRAFNRRSAG